MLRLFLRARARVRDALKPIFEAVIGGLIVALLKLIRYFDHVTVANLFSRVARTIGPLMREQRIGRANLTAAFPEKTPQEIETILDGVWDNLGRVAAEFAHLDHIWDYDPGHPEGSRIEFSPRSEQLFEQLRLDGKPALIFACHLGNWEMPALAAAQYDLNASILYRRPNIPAADRVIHDLRSLKMGKLIAASHDAPHKLAHELLEGQHVAMLVDQYFTNGVKVKFFGRETNANPMLARLLRQVDCPIHGTRIIRLPGNRFRAELSEEIEPVRDAKGKVDIQGTMQAITTVIEGWVREHPEQWLWLHRRWR